MTAQKKRQPLTREQQATVAQWRPLAIKFMRKAIHARGLSHFDDEVEGLAADALMGAIYVWDPKRGTFATCLAWWVKSIAKTFHAHGARAVHQSAKRAESQDALSLNTPVHVNNHSGTTVVTTWQDVLEDESTPDPTDAVDAPHLYREALRVLPRLVAGKGAKPKRVRYAKASVRMWALRNVEDSDPDDVTLEKIGQEYGISRERVRQREAKVQAAFERWAETLRKEAA